MPITVDKTPITIVGAAPLPSLKAFGVEVFGVEVLLFVEDTITPDTTAEMPGRPCICGRVM